MNMNRLKRSRSAIRRAIPYACASLLLASCGGDDQRVESSSRTPSCVAVLPEIWVRATDILDPNMLAHGLGVDINETGNALLGIADCDQGVQGKRLEDPEDPVAISVTGLDDSIQRCIAIGIEDQPQQTVDPNESYRSLAVVCLPTVGVLS